MSDTVYSVVNFTNVNSKARERPREDVVYSEVTISGGSRGGKENLKTENTGPSSLSRRRGTWCLGTLCFLQFICIIILAVYLLDVQPKQHSHNYSILLKEWSKLQGDFSILGEEWEELQRNFSIGIKYLQEQNDELQEQNNQTLDQNTQLREQNGQLQEGYSKLEAMKNNLVSEKNWFQQECSSLRNEKNRVQNNYDSLLGKLPVLEMYCHSTEKGRVCDPCPRGWKKHSSKCYYFSTSNMTWNESENNCSKQAAHLVTVNSKEEQEFISKEGNSSYWIGLADSLEEGVWRWVDGTKLAVVKRGQGFWLLEEPNNKNQESAVTANCVISLRNGWSDEACEDQHRWICETETLVLEPLATR